jgi:hypothetical protein
VTSFDFLLRKALRRETLSSGMTLAKKFLQGATLAFTGFWLLATSRAAVPARDCFIPFKERELVVTLGPMRPPADPKLSNCAELDGLREGAVVRVTLSRSGPRPELRETPEEACWGYDTKALSGPDGLSEVHSVPPQGRARRVLFEAEAKLANAASAPQCRGSLRFTMAPAAAVPPGRLLDPLRAGPEPWLLRRILHTSDGTRCPVPYCDDTFEVRSVTLAAP